MNRKAEWERPEHDYVTDHLRAEVALTRDRVSADLEAVSAKLSPEHMKAEAKQAVMRMIHRQTREIRQKVVVAARAVAALARAKPVHAALLGVGLGVVVWKVAARRRPRFELG